MPALELRTQRATKTADNVDSTTLAYPKNVQSGSLVVVVGGFWKATSTTLAVTDTLGTTYTVSIGTTISWAGGVGHPFIAWGITSSSGANTVTVNPGGAASGNYINFAITEVLGISAANVTGTSSTGTSTTPSCSVTTTGSDEFIVSILNCATGSTFTPTSPLIQLGEDESGAREPYNACFRMEPSSAGSITSAWSMGTSRAWSAHSVSFTPSVSGGIQEYTSQRNTNSSASTSGLTCAYPANVTSGSLLLVTGTVKKTSISGNITISDSLSTSYSVIQGSILNSDRRTYIGYGVASSGGANTVTVTPGNASSAVVVSVQEIARPYTGGTPLDVDGGSASGSSTAPSGTVTPTISNTLTVGAATFITTSGITITPTASCQLVEDESSNSPVNVSFGYQGAASTYTFNWVLSVSEDWIVQTANFGNAAGAGASQGQAPRSMHQFRLRRAA